MHAGEVLRNWDEIKRTEPGREAGIFGEVPENLPGPLHARKVQRRAASRGFDLQHVPYDAVSAHLEQLEAGMLLYDAFYRWCRDATSETHNLSSHKSPKSADRKTGARS